jgi:hypothetical protein
MAECQRVQIVALRIVFCQRTRISSTLRQWLGAKDDKGTQSQERDDFSTPSEQEFPTSSTFARLAWILSSAVILWCGHPRT